VKGIIFNLVEGFVVAEGGEGAWDGLLDSAGLDGGYTSLGDYADEELMTLVTAYSRTHDVEPADATRTIGEHALTGLAARYPEFFEPHRHTRDMLLTLNDVIHPEVRKLHPAANPPDFVYGSTDAEAFVMGYSSARRLCFLAEGMITAAAAHYGEQVTISQSECMHDGAERCLIRCTFDETPR
jgi:hypothetical protein